jgi:paraquat-inducible protein A
LGEQLILCHDCDLPIRLGAVPPGGSARCPRCRALLLRRVRDSVDRTLAFALAGLLLLAVANAFPFLAMKMKGLVTETTLATGVQSLYRAGRPLVASLVLLTTILAPLAHLSLLLYVLLPLKLGVRAPFAVPCFRWLHRIQAWSMMEVFMLGVLVSLVKLAGMAQLVPGIALWAFVALIPVVAAASSSLDAQLVWDRIGRTA